MWKKLSKCKQKNLIYIYNNILLYIYIKAKMRMQNVYRFSFYRFIVLLLINVFITTWNR